jgi:hypothetical protein
MKSELEEKLFNKYPKIFCGKDKPITENLMSFGFECGGGWYWLIDNLCGAIQAYCDSRNDGVRIRNNALHKQKEEDSKTPKKGRWEGNVIEEKEWQVEATQVKQKFGGLRFYISGADDMVHGMITLAEHLSYEICESCGSTENIKQTKGGWIFSLCPKCTEERGKL